jgi:hypothetical protein
MRTDLAPRIRKIILLAGMAWLVLACSFLPGAAIQPTSTGQPAMVETASVTTLPPQTADLLAACPKPTGETQLYVNFEDGYCLLYPNGFAPQPGMGVPALPLLNIIGPRVITPAPKQQEGNFNAGLSIQRNGPPEGMDSQAYAAKWLQRFAPGMDLPQETINIGGIPAIKVRNLPSYGSLTGGFVVSPFARYTINLTPEPEGSDPALAAQAEMVWDTVVNSIVFFEPQKDMGYISSESVCPMAGEGETGYVNPGDGYCMVYPADYHEDSSFPGRILSGPILGSMPDFPNIQTNLMVGTFGIANGKAPRDFLAQLPTNYYDPSSVVDMTIGGAPAVVYNNLAGPWRSRNAYIVLPRGDVYTIVSQPDDPAQFPEGLPYLNKLFNSVVMSLQFFTPWR